MTITAETTDEQLLAPIASARGRLAEHALGTESTSETLAGYVNDVARAEGVARANGVYRDALRDSVSEETKQRILFNLLTNGPDDTWSGRKNDVRRSYFDGLLQRVVDLLRGY